MTDAEVTRFTDVELNALRESARRVPAFIDPCVVRRVADHVTADRRDWATAVLGHSFTSTRRLSWQDVVLLDHAAAAEPDPPESPSLRAARAALAAEREATRQRVADKLTEWRTLRDRLPVAVEVVHNYTSHRHLGHYTQGVDHIRLMEPLQVGRLRRDARRTLCWTPSRDQYLTHFSDGYEDRWPDCVTCVRIAGRVAR